MSGLLCAGDIYFDRFNDANLSTGLVLLGNTTKLGVQEQSELKERISKGRETYGQALDSIYIKQPAQFSMTLDEFNRSTASMALLGVTAEVTQTAGPIVDEDFVAGLEVFKPLLNSNLAQAGFVVTNAAASVTYVEGTDYVVNRRLGLLKITGATITEAQALKVDYAKLAHTGYKVSGGTKPTVRGKLILDGKNLATGESVILTLLDLSMTPGSEIDFLSDEFVPIEFSGSAATPAGQTGPYTLEVRPAA